MKILLLVSAFDGLTQRAWSALRRAGHHVTVEFALDEATIVKGTEVADPDLIICPYLTEPVPERVRNTWRTIIIHPGPVGDLGPSPLDRAILRGLPIWGVTAMQAAAADTHAGPVWSWRIFAMPPVATSKSELYKGPVADAAVACILEAATKASDPDFVPTPLDRAPRPVPGTGPQPEVHEADRSFAWQAGSEEIVRRIRASDTAPGVRVILAGRDVLLSDVHEAALRPGRRTVPGTILARTDDAVEVATGDGSVWIGQLREVTADGTLSIKLPATAVLSGRIGDIPYNPDAGPAVARYRQFGEVGELRLQAYRGALSTAQCRRLYAALRAALNAPTRALVLRGSAGMFCTGLHLNVIDAAGDAAAEAWANTQAFNDVCRLLLGERRQELITVFDGDASAGGVMLGLTGDVVVARDGVVLNPYYDRGLTGSELHTYTLPRRVGEQQATRLLTDKLPVDATDAHSIGLIDAVGPAPAPAFDRWLADLAAHHADLRISWQTDQHSPERRPLAYFEVQELAGTAQDIFDDRNGFAAARAGFVRQHRPAHTPARLALHRA